VSPSKIIRDAFAETASPMFVGSSVTRSALAAYVSVPPRRGVGRGVAVAGAVTVTEVQAAMIAAPAAAPAAESSVLRESLVARCSLM
jgi:hypothetical protein